MVSGDKLLEWTGHISILTVYKETNEQMRLYCIKPAVEQVIATMELDTRGKSASVSNSTETCCLGFVSFQRRIHTAA